MLGDLSGKAALVTGGGQGIGRGIALVFAEQGADVAVADLDLDAARAVAEEVQALGRKGLGLALDVTSRQQVDALVAELLSRWGRLDILVNNAGVAKGPGPNAPEDDREDDWDATFSVNVKGVVFCTKAVMPHFMERRYGKIVNVASVAARLPQPKGPAYGATKAAVIHYTRSMAALLAPYGVNVNGICPGNVWSAFHEQLIEEARERGDQTVGNRDSFEVFSERSEEMIPLHRAQTAEDMGKLAAFLASEDARNITGQSIQLDGGMVMV
jgi:NAD(P)-dependent dehydrogenase (short-subunit alcohol dehydrogenase family)